MTTSDAIEALRVAVPEFDAPIDEHVAGFDEMLPHVLFGDLARFVLAAHESRDTDVEQRSLAFLDRALREGDDEVQNLVAVSFVENVGPHDREQRDFIRTWPKALRAEAERQRELQGPST
jgi:hypothetical protein